ncbi:MAG: hypothetical protein LAO03_18115 [Acidobacteriia bacterium]|nr:hypothetical protein [Terriglobia bacterium]
MDTTKLEYLAERMRLQKEAMQEGIERDKYTAEVLDLVNRIWNYPATTEERQRLGNSLTFFGLVNYLMECGLSDEQMTTAINHAVEQGKVKRPDDSGEGTDKVAAALCALELEELGLATMDSLLRIRLSL